MGRAARLRRAQALVRDREADQGEKGLDVLYGATLRPDQRRQSAGGDHIRVGGPPLFDDAVHDAVDRVDDRIEHARPEAFLIGETSERAEPRIPERLQ